MLSLGIVELVVLAALVVFALGVVSLGAMLIVRGLRR